MALSAFALLPAGFLRGCLPVGGVTIHSPYSPAEMVLA